MSKLFEQVKLTQPKTSLFDLTHDVKFSGKIGKLMPILAMDCLPGDNVKIGAQSLIRFAPLVAPLMHRFDVSIHYFFVPNRILWENWEKFITDFKDSGGNTPAHPFMIASMVNQNVKEVSDYMGLQAANSDIDRINPFPFAAYNKIYDDYYRDQNLIVEEFTPLLDGENNIVVPLHTRSYEHDYFTACLPFAQKGDPVQLPIAGFTDVPVHAQWFANNSVQWQGNLVPGPGTIPVAIPIESPQFGLDSSLIAKTSEMQITSATINDLREAFRLQEWLEKQPRGGSRYIESIKAHFGVNSSDGRLQRAEYITGVKSPIIISEVLSNSGNQERPQGDMAGHAVGVNSGGFGRHYCEEHGYIIGIASVMPKTCYQQGTPRHFSRMEMLDYAFPEFANIGEQEVKNKEIYSDHTNPDGTFGYLPRYSEYKVMPNRVAGQFKTTLNHWHAGRIFTSPPNLNKQFLECVNDKRIFAVTDQNEDELWCHVLHEITAVRKLPKFGTPTF